ncbi:Zinc finger protein 862 [Lucilia cuprina]|nr:Zinc finger protein 862 [Lucilia cuprina]
MERYLNRSDQNIDVQECSSDSEDSCLPTTSKRIYTQKLRKKWFNDPRLSKWIIELNKQQVKCKFCQCILKSKLSTLIAHGKTSKHIKMSAPFSSNSQKTLQFNQRSSNSKIKEAELLKSLYVAIHTSIRSTDHLVRLQTNIFDDNKTAIIMTLGRTKCTALIKSVLAPHFKQLLIDDISDSKFSLIIDESTDITIEKYLGIVIRYYSKTNKNIVSTFLQLCPLEDGSAQGITSAILNVLKEFNLNISNMVGLGTDNARVMTGINRGVIANLKEKNKNIVLVPCVCHSIQLSVSSASKTLPEEIEYLVAETYSWFSKSTI